MKSKVHRLKYNHGDGRAGTRCGIELRDFGNGFRSQSHDPLRRVPHQFDRVVDISETHDGTTCKRCAHVPYQKPRF